MKVKRVLKKLAHFALDVVVVIFGLCVVDVGKYMFSLGLQAFTLQNLARVFVGAGLMHTGFVLMFVAIVDACEFERW